MITTMTDQWGTRPFRLDRVACCKHHEKQMRAYGKPHGRHRVLRLTAACGCHATIDAWIKRSRHEETNQRRAAITVGRRGWVVDRDRRIWCSVTCQREDATDRHSRRPRDLLFWWRECHHFDGDPPPCVCSLLEAADGMLYERRDHSCPWHMWEAEWSERRRWKLHALLRRWLIVENGTLVVEDNDRSRGVGAVSGRPKLLTDSEGKPWSAVMPVSDWSPHPSLEDLRIYDGPWPLPIVEEETP